MESTSVVKVNGNSTITLTQSQIDAGQIEKTVKQLQTQDQKVMVLVVRTSKSKVGPENKAKIKTILSPRDDDKFGTKLKLSGQQERRLNALL